MDSKSKRRTGKNSTDDSSASAGKSYSDDARSERQLRIVDAMPRRRWVLAVLLLAGLLCIGSLIALHAQLPQWSAKINPGDLAAINLTAPAGLAAWFSSSLLLIAAVASLQVYALRRHKSDDYRGRYRVWLWASAVLAFASVDASTQLRLAVRGVMVHVTGQTLYGDGTIWWIILYSLVMGSLVVRMMIEMRHSATAVTALLIAIIGYGAGIGLQLGLITLGEPSTAVMAHPSIVMFSHLMILFSIWLYARHVYLDAHGKLLRSSTNRKSALNRKSKPDLSPETATSLADEAALKLNKQINREELTELEEDLLEQESRPGKQRRAKRDKSPDPNVLQMDGEFGDEAQTGRLSKAQRRALKKQRRERRAA